MCSNLIVDNNLCYALSISSNIGLIVKDEILCPDDRFGYNTRNNLVTSITIVRDTDSCIKNKGYITIYNKSNFDIIITDSSNILDPSKILKPDKKINICNATTIIPISKLFINSSTGIGMPQPPPPPITFISYSSVLGPNFIRIDGGTGVIDTQQVFHTTEPVPFRPDGRGRVIFGSLRVVIDTSQNLGTGILNLPDIGLVNFEFPLTVSISSNKFILKFNDSKTISPFTISSVTIQVPDPLGPNQMTSILTIFVTKKL